MDAVICALRHWMLPSNVKLLVSQVEQGGVLSTCAQHPLQLSLPLRLKL